MSTGAPEVHYCTEPHDASGVIGTLTTLPTPNEPCSKEGTTISLRQLRAGNRIRLQSVFIEESIELRDLLEEISENKEASINGPVVIRVMAREHMAGIDRSRSRHYWVKTSDRWVRNTIQETEAIFKVSETAPSSRINVHQLTVHGRFQGQA